MIIVTVILAWLLVNTWATLIVLKLCNETPHFWEDYLWVFFMAIITPIPPLVVRWINTIKYNKKQKWG